MPLLSGRVGCFEELKGSQKKWKKELQDWSHGKLLQYPVHVKHRWPENRLNYADISFLLLTRAGCDGKCTNLDLSVVPLIPFVEHFLHVNCGWLLVGLPRFWNIIDTPLERERKIVSFAVQPDLFSLIGSFLERTNLEKSWRIIGQIIPVNSNVLLLIFCQWFHVCFKKGPNTL